MRERETEEIPFPLRKINDVLSGMDVFAARCRIAEMQGEAKSDVAWPIARVSVDRWGWLLLLVRPRGVVSGLVEEGESSQATVQDVTGEVSSSEARAARHEDLLSSSGSPCFCFRPSIEIALSLI